MGKEGIVVLSPYLVLKRQSFRQIALEAASMMWAQTLPTSG